MPIHQFIKIKVVVFGVFFFSRQSYATRHWLPSLPTSHQKKKKVCPLVSMGTDLWQGVSARTACPCRKEHDKPFVPFGQHCDDMLPKPFCPLRPDAERKGYDHFKAVHIKPAPLSHPDVPLCRAGVQQSIPVYLLDLRADGMSEHAKQVSNLKLAHPYFAVGYDDVSVLVHRDCLADLAVYVFPFHCHAILIFPNDALSLLPSMERSVSSFSVVIFA